MKHLNRALFLALVGLLCLLTYGLIDLARGPIDWYILPFFDVCPNTAVTSTEKDNIVTQTYVDFKGHTVTVVWQLRRRLPPVMIAHHARPMPNVCAWYRFRRWSSHGAYSEE